MVLQSLLGDFVSSAVVSIIADLCLNFFFVPPVFSFRVSDSSDIWALIAFLITGLVITRLMTQSAAGGGDIGASAPRDEAVVRIGATLARTGSPRRDIDAKAVALFREVFRLQAVCLYDGMNTELHSDGDSQNGLAERTRAAYISRQDADDAVSGVFIRCLRAAGKIIGAIGFDGLRDAELTAGPLAELAALCWRERAFFAMQAMRMPQRRRKCSAGRFWMPWRTNSRLPWPR